MPDPRESRPCPDDPPAASGAGRGGESPELPAAPPAASPPRPEPPTPKEVKTIPIGVPVDPDRFRALKERARDAAHDERPPRPEDER